MKKLPLLSPQRTQNMIPFIRCSMLGLWSAYHNKIKMKTTKNYWQVKLKKIDENL